MTLEINGKWLRKWAWALVLAFAYFPLRFMWDTFGEVGRVAMCLIAVAALVLLAAAIKEGA